MKGMQEFGPGENAPLRPLHRPSVFSEVGWEAFPCNCDVCENLPSEARGDILPFFEEEDE